MPPPSLTVFPPDEFRIRIKRRGRKMADFVYTEIVRGRAKTKGIDDLYTYFSSLFQQVPKGQITRTKNSVTIKVTIPFEIVSDALVGEFLQWSSTGKKTFAEMCVSRDVGHDVKIVQSYGKALRMRRKKKK